MARRVLAQDADGKLIDPRFLSYPQVYPRLAFKERKAEFRKALLAELHRHWLAESGAEIAASISSAFTALAEEFTRNGAVVFTDVLPTASFNALKKNYDSLMEKSGSAGILHSFANLLKHPTILQKREWSDAFFHPLFVAVVAYRAWERCSHR